ncbi:hypothetical protein SAMN04487996_104339 [Dyadobacter soli]|uniref:Uncharacterized protein n=1 Tax=Dyadobacter soli TaxID=659014 RepID=A0A1G7BXM0_9BACT|nr:hypothetical protein [Dyadobacter soli]SDE31769.1 hypothetical protein SAMN04487996_104339 [Dyadobacter soli]
MKEKIRHLIAEKLIQKGEAKMSLHRLIRIDGATDERVNRILDHIRSLEEDIEMLERILKQLKQ